jgi:hypothetical protein
MESGECPQVKGLGLHNQLVGDLKDGGEFVSRNYVLPCRPECNELGPPELSHVLLMREEASAPTGAKDAYSQPLSGPFPSQNATRIDDGTGIASSQRCPWAKLSSIAQIDGPRLHGVRGRLQTDLPYGDPTTGYRQNPSNQGQRASARSHFPRYRPRFPTTLVRGYAYRRAIPPIG